MGKKRREKPSIAGKRALNIGLKLSRVAGTLDRDLPRGAPILQPDRCKPRAAHPPMVTGPGPLDCFRAFLLSGPFTPWLVVGLVLFAFARFFAFSSLLFVFSLFLFHISHFCCFLKFLNRNKIENWIKIQIGTNFKVATNFKLEKISNQNKFQIETNFKLE
jgi:hypothetical protein